MSYESILSNLGTYMNMQPLGLGSSISPLGYMGTSYGYPFSSALSNVLAALSANGINAQNVAGYRTISANSELQKALNELGYGNMLVLVPEEYQKRVEENAENTQKVGETFKRWRANYDAVNANKRQRQSQNRSSSISAISHNCSLHNCAFGTRV